MALTPFLMFGGQAEEAIRFYVATFPEGELVGLERYGPNEDGAEGSVKLATFRLAGQSLMCIDSPVEQAFGFTPAISFFLDCEDHARFDDLHDRLVEDGDIFVPVGEYPFAERFVWLRDRFGVSWQLSVGRR